MLLVYSDWGLSFEDCNLSPQLLFQSALTPDCKDQQATWYWVFASRPRLEIFSPELISSESSTTDL